MKKRSILCVCIIALATFAVWAHSVDAYGTYQSASDTNPGPRDNCAQCHPGFDNGLSSGAPSHAQHLLVTGNCGLCHPTGDFGSIPVNTSSSVDGISCIGCHGRAENQANGQVTGAGLRQRHTRVGLFCGGCHQDNDPETFTTVGENVLPPYYSRDDVNVKDPCLVVSADGGEDYSGNGRGLDNDGDLAYDGDDSDCQPCTGDLDCDDGDTCNGDETCNLTTGQCEAGIPLDCNDDVTCTVDSCEPATGCVNTPDDANCDDNNVCNGSETCDFIAGCQPGADLDCDDGELCTTDTCDSVTGCANVPVECPAGEQCDSADGVCKPEPECTVDADCDNGFFCDGAETCDTATGTCQAGTPPDCDDGVDCTVDTCDEVNDSCVNTPDDTSCDDGNVCNGLETCDPANDCQDGTPLNCDDGNLCTTDSCDPLTGCANVAVMCPEGQQCDTGTGECVPSGCTSDADCLDEFFCNGEETCDTDSGTCLPGTPVDCDDGVVCTADTCDETNDACVNTPDDASCDDGDVCNGVETCDPINDCEPGTPLVCDDGDLCTTDGCDPVAGCVFTPVECPAGQQCDSQTGECVTPPECTVDADCDDTQFCNGAETCDTATGTCQPGTPPDCDDGVECTMDTCDEVNDECVNTPDDAACPDDGLFCTGDEVCDPAAGCVSTGDPCSGGTICNEDTNTCDVVSDKVTICHIPPGNPKKAKTKSISAMSVDDHLAHGDYLGPCD